ncbi:YD repeat-containing protein [Pseudoduganella flava]|uniref:YD repeat-containing protein n=1 Tax=Pseudoduganella flava TaxID=871742 RepID=A0A562PZJ1_9BURK|nr:hypothetical protein [Pseudoduganella flava]QGZ38574.1 hypothetical protein GO485_05560 [Pseudoduganella flava]TWI49862.1 YD repeat-containing protein [Pseudoduganella flava]
MAIDGADGKPVARYTYNARGERIAKTVYGAERRATTTYSIYRDQRLVAGANANGVVTAHYLYLQGKPVAMVKTAPQTSLTARLLTFVTTLGGLRGHGGERSALVATYAG